MRYTHYNHKKRKWPWKRIFVLVYCVLFATQIQQEDYRTLSVGLEIKVPKTSLPIAAVYDIRERPRLSSMEDFPSDLKFDKLKAEEEIIIPKIINIKEGITIDKNGFLISGIRDFTKTNDGLTIYNSNKNKDLRIFNSSLQVRSYKSEKEFKTNLYAGLTEEESERVSRAENLIKDLFELNNEDKIDNVFNNAVRSENINKNNDKLIVIAHNDKNSKYNYPNKKIKRNNRHRYASNDFTANPSNESFDNGEFKTSGFEVFTGLSSGDIIKLTKDKSEKRVKWLKGHISLNEGLALLAGSEIKIYLENEFGEIEKAEINYNDANYALFTESNEGILITELVDSEQNIIGRNEISLDEIIKNGTLEKEYKIDVEILPYFRSKRIELLSAYSTTGNEIPEEKVNVYAEFSDLLGVSESGLISLEKWKAGSSFISVASKENHYNSVSIHNVENVKKRIFPVSMIDALTDLVGGNRLDKANSIVWGEALWNGNGLENVEITISDRNAIGPIFLNDLYIPDKSMKSTGDVGVFSFVNLSPGIHSITYKYGAKLYKDTIFVAENAVSHIQRDFTRANHIQLRVYDLKAEPDDLEISLDGFSQQKISGQSFQLKSYQSDSPLWLIGESRDSIKARYLINRKNGIQIIPSIERRWWHEQSFNGPSVFISLNKNISKIQLDHLEISNENNQMHFYDKQGAKVANISSASFIVIDQLNIGLQSIQLFYENEVKANYILHAEENLPFVLITK